MRVFPVYDANLQIFFINKQYLLRFQSFTCFNFLQDFQFFIIVDFLISSPYRFLRACFGPIYLLLCVDRIHYFLFVLTYLNSLLTPVSSQTSSPLYRFHMVSMSSGKISLRLSLKSRTRDGV